MNKENLLRIYAEKMDRAKNLTAKEQPTKEELEEAKTLLNEAEKIKGDVELMNRMADQEKWMQEPVGTKAAHLGSVEVVKDEADRGFERPGEYFKAVKDAALYPGRVDRRLYALQEKATGMSEAIPADGGYLLPQNMAAGILERMYATGNVLSRVASDPVSAGNSITYNGIDETSRVAGSRWGGLRGYWVAEGGTLTASKPTFRQLELKLKKVAALCYATDEQLEDTPNLASWLGRTVPDELRFQVEDAIYEGDGVGKPLGIMQSPCLVSCTRIDANEIDSTDIANLWSRRWVGASDYVWLINQAIFPQLINLAVGNWPVYVPAGGFAAAPYGSIYGRPVIEVEYASALGTTGDIMLASLSQYQTITKGGVRAESSIHVQFTTDEMAFRFIYRIDGAPTWHGTLTPFKGSATQSPFVVLTTASA